MLQNYRVILTHEEKKYGSSVRSSQQSNRKTRDRRLFNLLKCRFKKKTSILDLDVELVIYLIILKTKI